MSEEWHKTHAVLLKSVAQAQGVLLAGLNALETKLTAMQVEQGKNQIKADLAHGTVLQKIAEHDENAIAINRKVDKANAEIGERNREHREALQWYHDQGLALIQATRFLSAKAKRKSKRKPRRRRKGK